MTGCIDHGKTRSLRPEGYAMVRASGKCQSLHRRVYEEHNGPIPDGLVVRHTCDNTRCINPEHLILGTRADNNRDRAVRGRSAKVVPSRQALTIEQVEDIRERYNPRRVGVSAPDGVYQMARDYGVDAQVIYRILRGEYHANRTCARY